MSDSEKVEVTVVLDRVLVQKIAEARLDLSDVLNNALRLALQPAGLGGVPFNPAELAAEKAAEEAAEKVETAKWNDYLK